MLTVDAERGGDGFDELLDLDVVLVGDQIRLAVADVGPHGRDERVDEVVDVERVIERLAVAEHRKDAARDAPVSESFGRLCTDRLADGRRELARGLVGIDDVLDAEILEVRRLLRGSCRTRRSRRPSTPCRGIPARARSPRCAARCRTPRRRAHSDALGLRALQVTDSQHAHVALMPQQLGHDRAERFIVTGHMYHDHDSSFGL